MFNLGNAAHNRGQRRRSQTLAQAQSTPASDQLMLWRSKKKSWMIQKLKTTIHLLLTPTAQLNIMSTVEEKTEHAHDGTNSKPHSKPTEPSPRSSRSIFEIPKPLKQVFDRFPMVTYAANALPQRSRDTHAQHTLYVFIDPTGAKAGRPSYNPGCLKWQVWKSASAHTVTFVQGEAGTDSQIHLLGLSQILRCPFCRQTIKQPCITIRRAAIPSTRA